MKISFKKQGFWNKEDKEFRKIVSKLNRGYIVLIMINLVAYMVQKNHGMVVLNALFWIVGVVVDRGYATYEGKIWRQEKKKRKKTKQNN